jgi:hypothetical protein
MKLTKAQREFLQRLYDYSSVAKKEMWTEPNPRDNKKTIRALAKKGLLESIGGGFRIRLTENGIYFIAGESKIHDELLQAIKGEICKICCIYPSVGQAMSEEPLTRLALAIAKMVETKFLKKKSLNWHS